MGDKLDELREDRSEDRAKFHKALTEHLDGMPEKRLVDALTNLLADFYVAGDYDQITEAVEYLVFDLDLPDTEREFREMFSLPDES